MFGTDAEFLFEMHRAHAAELRQEADAARLARLAAGGSSDRFRWRRGRHAAGRNPAHRS